jgi:endonuclease/exonuclease/phosphatase family metal-dependent hydrolase
MRGFLAFLVWLINYFNQRRLKARRVNSLRVMCCWNLGERINEELPHFVGLIKSVDPDIVCLNETRRNDGFDQIENIARMAGYGFWKSEAIAGSNGLERTTAKTIGIISKIQVSEHEMLQANWSPPSLPSWLTLFAEDGPYRDMEVSFSYKGIKHFLYSVRHSAHTLAMNRESFLWLEDRIRQRRTEARNSGQPIPNFIVAGDFNGPGAGNYYPDRALGFNSVRIQPPHILSFFTQVDLIDATINMFHPEKDPWNGTTEHRPVCMVDVIAYSGDYDVLKASEMMFGNSLSDHPYVFVDLAQKKSTIRQILDLDVYFPPPFDFSSGNTQPIVSYDHSDRITATLVRTNIFDPLITITLKVEPHITWRKEISLFTRDGTLIGTIFTDGSNKGPVTMTFPYADRSGMFMTLSKAQGSWFTVTPRVEKVRIYLENIERGQAIEFNWTQD